MSSSDDFLQQLGDCIRSRRTVGQFEPERVSRDLIMDAIEVARWAPNHRMTEPWRFYLLGSETIARSVELTRIVVTERKGEKLGEFKAADAAKRPGWMVVTSARSDDELLQQEDYAAVCCAVQNLMLYLSAAGVATKWATGPITRDNRFYELLDIAPDRENIIGIIWYGYPKIMPQQQRKAVSESVVELG